MPDILPIVVDPILDWLLELAGAQMLRLLALLVDGR
jgi:hypothetical protein